MHPFPNKWIGAGGLLLAACLLATSAPAQTAGEGLSPTLDNIKRTHVVRLGYRESSPPFSFLDHSTGRSATASNCARRSSRRLASKSTTPISRSNTSR